MSNSDKDNKNLEQTWEKAFDLDKDKQKEKGLDNKSLEQAWDLYMKNWKSLKKQNPEGGFVAIFQDDLIGVFATRNEAKEPGAEKYPEHI